MQLTKEGIATGKAGVELVKGKNLGLTYDGDRYLFEGVTVGVAQGLKLALVGPNGEGKSSLMKVLAGMEKPQKGTVESLSKLTTAYVEQEPSLHPGQRVVEFFLNPSAVSHPVEGVKAFFEHREAELQAERADANDEKANARLLRAVTKMDETQAWSLEGHIQRLFVGLRVESLLDRDASTLSGGERKRVALAAAFVHQPALLLLDEPTNHLDIEAIQWLENEISNSPDLTALIVTHDRAFLEGACQEILELDRSQIFRHRGTWEGFVEAKQQRIKQEETINTATRDKLKQELAWARSACKARATKSEWRLQNMEEMAAKLEEADRRLWKSKSSIQLESSVQRLGTSSVSFQKACLTIPSMPPRPVLDNFNFDLGGSQHIGIIGGNGVGKSTFLKAMQGLLPLQSGKVEIGKNVVFGYVSQAGLEFQKDVTIFEFMRQAVGASPTYGNEIGSVIETRCNDLLEKFGFYISHDPRTARVKSLSGGELRRLQLIEVLAREPNFLVLDEPTNDLDLNSIAALEEFLQEFRGVLLLVSHDRYFLDNVCESFLVLDGTGNVELWEDSAAEYLEYRNAQRKAKELAESRAQQQARRLAEKESKRPKASGRDALSDLLAQFDTKTKIETADESRLTRQSSGDAGSGSKSTEDHGEFKSGIFGPLAGGTGRSRERLDGGSLGASSLPVGHNSVVFSSGPAADIFKKYNVPQKGGGNAQGPQPPDLDRLRKKPNKKGAPDLDALRQKLLQQVKK